MARDLERWGAYGKVQWTYIKADTMQALDDELVKARTKFPGNRYLYTALAEEFGELGKAILQKKPRSEIIKEAVQTAAMAIRIIEEGDPAYNHLTDDEAKP